MPQACLHEAPLALHTQYKLPWQPKLETVYHYVMLVMLLYKESSFENNVFMLLCLFNNKPINCKEVSWR